MTPSARESSGQSGPIGRPGPAGNAGPEQGVAVAERRHWAHRDQPFRRPGTATPFRRPPAADPARAVPVVEPAETAMPSGADPDTGDLRIRAWTTLGTATRRPRTSDRPEVTTPPIAPAHTDAPTRTEASTGTEAPAPAEGAGRAAARDRAAERDRTAEPDPTGADIVGTDHGDDLDAAKADPAPGESQMSGTATGVDGPGILGGPLRDIRPHRATANRAATGSAEPVGRRREKLVPIIVLAISVLAIAAVAVQVLAGGGGLGAVLQSNVSATGAERTITAPLAGRQAATFELGGLTSVVAIRTEDLGDDLYRITTPEESESRPWASVDRDTVRLSLSAAAGAPAGVEVLLSARAIWTVKLSGGAQEHRIDLSKGQVAGVDLAGGARGVELNLPAGKGTVPLSVTGAVDQLVIRSPQNSPVRLKLAAGAKTVSAGQRTLRDVRPGATFTPRDWETSGRYDATVTSQAALVSVESRA